jgi:hypothetical protein
VETVTNNLIPGNNLALPDAIHYRVLLTTLLQWLAVGNTILLQQESSVSGPKCALR